MVHVYIIKDHIFIQYEIQNIGIILYHVVLTLINHILKLCRKTQRNEQLPMTPDGVHAALLFLSDIIGGPLPSGGSRPLGPLGRKPVMAHSTICLFCRSTDLDVSVSSVLGHALKAFPARVPATWGGRPKGGVTQRSWRLPARPPKKVVALFEDHFEMVLPKFSFFPFFPDGHIV